MNTMIWLLAGSVAGWVGYSYLKFNEGRGMMVSIIIGMVGGFAGGKLLAPMLGAAVSASNEFSPFSMVVAIACAGACLVIGNLVSERYGV